MLTAPVWLPTIWPYNEQIVQYPQNVCMSRLSQYIEADFSLPEWWVAGSADAWFMPTKD